MMDADAPRKRIVGDRGRPWARRWLFCEL